MTKTDVNLPSETPQPDQTLLSVDLGLRLGMALFSSNGTLLWSRSHHYASRNAMRRAAISLLQETENLSHLILEGGGALADVWQQEGEKLGLSVQIIPAETWRQCFLHPKERRNSSVAKHNSILLAKEIHRWSGTRAQATLRHDAAEAVLAGLWGVMELGWLTHLPTPLQKHLGKRTLKND